MKPILIIQIPSEDNIIQYNLKELEEDYHVIIFWKAKEFLVKIISKPCEYAS